MFISCFYREIGGKCAHLGLKNSLVRCLRFLKLLSVHSRFWGSFFQSNPLKYKERHGGESGSRTHGAGLAHTRFPVVHLRPLGHLSVQNDVWNINRWMPIKSTRRGPWLVWVQAFFVIKTWHLRHSNFGGWVFFNSFFFPGPWHSMQEALSRTALWRSSAGIGG